MDYQELISKKQEIYQEFEKTIPEQFPFDHYDTLQKYLDQLRRYIKNLRVSNEETNLQKREVESLSNQNNKIKSELNDDPR